MLQGRRGQNEDEAADLPETGQNGISVPGCIPCREYIGGTAGRILVKIWFRPARPDIFHSGMHRTKDGVRRFLAEPENGALDRMGMQGLREKRKPIAIMARES